MEQTLPLSESSTMPTRKMSVMRWVAFVLALITGFGFLIFFTSSTSKLMILDFYR